MAIKNAKEYYQSVSLKNYLLSSPAKFWRHFSSKKQPLSSFCIDGETVTDKCLIAKTFNQFFCSVFTNDDGRKPTFNPSIECPPIDNISVTEEGILSLLLNLNIKKSPGMDGIPTAFLMRYAEWCSKYLCILFNKSLSCAALPNDWKYAKVTPIPKTENRSLITSYRPISLLPTCAKTLEHIIFKHISVFLNDNNIIDSRQHGFRKGLSTTTQLLETIHEFAAILDKQGQIDMIFIDFEKAFDRVSHSKLLLKLQPILKNDLLLAWISAYLSSRRQSVFIDGVRSDSAPVQSGIPQGSVLGPLFFLIFVNDIIQVVNVKIRLFADDCILYQEINNCSDQVCLNSSLASVEAWCATWQMTMNAKKTVAMSITRKRNPLKFSYSTGGNILSTVSSYKYLGLVITSDLRWNEHMSYISKKAMRKLGYLRRSLRQSTQEIRLLAYKTYIRPILEYASVVWDPYTQKNITQLESIQRKSVRFIFNCYSWQVSPTVLLNNANLEPLKLRRYRDRLKYMYLLYHDMLGIDKDVYINLVSKRPTRSNHSKKIKEFSCRTNVFKNSFFPRTVREWNALTSSTVECPTVQSFCGMLNSIEAK